MNSVAEAQSLYDDWAKTYDTDMNEQGQNYAGPAVAAAYVLKSLGTTTIDPNVEILDAGCGTGLVGTFLAKVGAKNIDGVDLSPGMLDIARQTGVYRSLKTTDLSQPLAEKDDSYDVVVCIGTFTQSHVGPDAAAELIRLTKPGGFLIFTVLETIWKTEGFEAKVAELVDAGKAKLVSSQLEDYRRAVNLKAMMIVLQIPE